MMKQSTLLSLALIAQVLKTECKPDGGMAPQWFVGEGISSGDSWFVGSTIKLQCPAIGFPTPTLKWYKNGEEFKRENRFNGFEVDENTNTIIMDSAVPTDAGRYTCEVENQQAGMVYIHVVKILQGSHSSPYLRARLPTDRTAVVGSDVELECKVFDNYENSAYILTWSRVTLHGVSSALENSGPNTSNKPMEVLHLRNVTLDDAGRYICSATNVWGTSQKSFQLTVIEG